MSVVLVTFGKKGDRKEFTLENGSSIIGRKIDADLRIPLAEVSRTHCEIRVDGNKVELRDLGSSNGTFVNDRKVVEATLSPGDRVGIGPVVFTVQIDGTPKDIRQIPHRTKPEAGPEAATAASDALETAEGSGEFDIDELGELDIDDLSDLDLGELGDEDAADLEEIDEADLIPDNDTESPQKS